MTRWVALLRGVNVNGVTVRSADLRAALSGAGFGRVSTVLASGNAVLDDDAPDTAAGRSDLRARVEAVLRERFGYDAWIVAVAADRLGGILAGYPFDRRDETHQPYVMFGSDRAELAELAGSGLALPGDGADRLRLADDGDVLYWEVPRGASTDTPFAKLSAAARWKPHVTTRNLRTLEKVLAAT
jgi:uncharacterized protein (DUF1697 family)